MVSHSLANVRSFTLALAPLSLALICILLHIHVCDILGTCLFLLRSPAISLGFTILGEIFAYVMGFFF